MRRIYVALLGLLIGLTFGAATFTVAASQSSKKHASSKKSSSKKKTTKSKKRSAPRQMQPDAERIREIQTALQREGYLTGSPTGRWDAATTDAMTRYQKANGFPATGKPEALSLKKLGLGAKYGN